MAMHTTAARVSSGIEELDGILSGGFLAESSYLIRGGPGQGKTTLGLHFLTGAGDSESALFIGFQEGEDQLRANAASVGLDVSGIHFLSLAPDEQFFSQQEGYDIFASSDVESEPMAAAVMEAVEQAAPKRIFIDSMTQLRFLSADIFQYRKQVLSLLRYLRERGATVLFSSERSDELPDEDLQFIADGVVTLDSGPDSSFLEVVKFRGSAFLRGAHQIRVGRNGLRVFPRPFPPGAQEGEAERMRWTSGVERLDAMLNGGLEAGTITLVTGPSGTGKSTLASMFVAEAATRGHRAAVFTFEEETRSLFERCDQLDIPLRDAYRRDLVTVEQIEPMRFLGNEFVLHVQRLVEERDLDIVVLDSIAGYELTLGQSETTKASLHALVKILARCGVSVILVNEVEAVTGQFRVSEKAISYLADNVIVLRYLEVDGKLQKVLGILKKRLSGFDRRFLPFDVGPRRLTIFAPDEELHGVLSGQQLPAVGTDG